MIKVIIISILLLISAIAKSIQDTLQFHYDTSIFKLSKNQNWWNPNLSWQNKWNWFKNYKILTWLLANPLVSITDAWHLFGFIRDFSLFICIPIISDNWWILLGYPIYRFIFHIFFTWIFNHKK